MKKLIIICAVAALISCFSMPANATSLFIESWGVTATNLDPITAPSNSVNVQEAYTGADPNGIVDPGYGGYAFDAKSAYIGFDGSKTYLAVVTGLPQGGAKDPWRYDNPIYNNMNDFNQQLEKYWYVPGSLALDIGGDGIYDFAVTTRANSNNATYAPAFGEGKLVSGNLQFANSKAWSDEENSINYAESDPWTVSGYDTEADSGVDFGYSSLGYVDGNEVFVIEAVIDTVLLGLNVGDELTMHWTMECGNDAIDVTAIVGPDGPPAVVPEPGTLLLLGSGIIGIVGLRKKFMV